MPSPLSPSETRALLDRLGHNPIKKLGQNFLIDGNIVRKSLELAKVSAGDSIVEIGPGLGTLTRALLDSGAYVYSIEKDKRLANHISSLIPEYGGRLHLIQGDALDHPLANIPPAVERFKIVANLPYAISTPWMDAVIHGPAPKSMTLMLQKEAAQRYVAVPGTKQFGSISIFLQAAYRTVQAWNVASSCFYPKPDVGSQLLHLESKTNSYAFPEEDRYLIRGLFSQRRKQIGSLLRKSDSPRAMEWLKRLDSLGIEANARSEQIDVDRWIQLSSGHGR